MKRPESVPELSFYAEDLSEHSDVDFAISEKRIERSLQEQNIRKGYE